MEKTSLPYFHFPRFRYLPANNPVETVAEAVETKVIFNKM